MRECFIEAWKPKRLHDEAEYMRATTSLQTGITLLQPEEGPYMVRRRRPALERRS